MKFPKQKFNLELERAVREYHKQHGDTNVELVAFVCDPTGSPLLLTRVTDEEGKQMSCLLEFYYYGTLSATKWELRECEGTERDDEYAMLCDYIGNTELEEELTEEGDSDAR